MAEPAGPQLTRIAGPRRRDRCSTRSPSSSPPSITPTPHTTPRPSPAPRRFGPRSKAGTIPSCLHRRLLLPWQATWPFVTSLPSRVGGARELLLGEVRGEAGTARWRGKRKLGLGWGGESVWVKCSGARPAQGGRWEGIPRAREPDGGQDPKGLAELCSITFLGTWRLAWNRSLFSPPLAPQQLQLWQDARGSSAAVKLAKRSDCCATCAAAHPPRFQYAVNCPAISLITRDNP